MEKVKSLFKTKFLDSKITVDDFSIIKLIGKGSYGKVYLVKKKDTEESLAMKILKKAEMIQKDQVSHIKTEKRIMELIDHPFIIKLKYAFHNKQKLYLISNFCPGGELFFHLNRVERFNEPSAKFYAAQIILALEHLHSMDIIYRDLKPENVMIDSDGYIKLTDFGLAKENINDTNKAFSFCGTPEYLAPEIIQQDKPYGKEVDCWSLGVILYEMLTGAPPFYHRDKDILFQQILKLSVRFPSFLSKDAIDLLGHIFSEAEIRPTLQEIKSHSFFNELKWNDLMSKKLKPPFIPNIKSQCDTKYVDYEFLLEPAKESVGDSVDSKDDLFKGFSFTNISQEDNNDEKSNKNKEIIDLHRENSNLQVKY